MSATIKSVKRVRKTKPGGFFSVGAGSNGLPSPAPGLPKAESQGSGDSSFTIVNMRKTFSDMGWKPSTYPEQGYTNAILGALCILGPSKVQQWIPRDKTVDFENPVSFFEKILRYNNTDLFMDLKPVQTDEDLVNYSADNLWIILASAFRKRVSGATSHLKELILLVAMNYLDLTIDPPSSGLADSLGLMQDLAEARKKITVMFQNNVDTGDKIEKPIFVHEEKAELEAMYRGIESLSHRAVIRLLTSKKVSVSKNMLALEEFLREKADDIRLKITDGKKQKAQPDHDKPALYSMGYMSFNLDIAKGFLNTTFGPMLCLGGGEHNRSDKVYYFLNLMTAPRISTGNSTIEIADVKDSGMFSHHVLPLFLGHPHRLERPTDCCMGNMFDPKIFGDIARTNLGLCRKAHAFYQYLTSANTSDSRGARVFPCPRFSATTARWFRQAYKRLEKSVNGPVSLYRKIQT